MSIYRGKDLRKGRCSKIGRVYLVTTNTVGRVQYFARWETGRIAARALYAEGMAGHVANLAWVVMPDHVHWLLELRKGALSAAVCRVKARIALSLNLHLQRRGPIWQKGFHDRALRREEDLKAAARYIITNPTRAGLVSRVGDYPFWDAIWV